MKKYACLIFVLALSLLLGSCIGPETEIDRGDTTPPSNETTSSPEKTPTTTTPSHSELYLPNEPIRYRIYGTATKTDLDVLTSLFAQLNKIKGFPGIYAADNESENLIISFLGVDDFNASFSEFIEGEDAYGATEFWYYNETNEIYTARIGYRTDTDQITRTSILIEEIINMLGVSDTVLREDSIVYQYSNDNTAPSDIDWVILKLLYNHKIKCGMDTYTCSNIIKELYY